MDRRDFAEGRDKMKLVLAGCEYSGKTTLVAKIQEWISETLGGTPGVHDHFTIPNLAHRELTDDEVGQVLALSPALKEEFLRYIISYHLSPSFMSAPDHLMVGFHFEEAVYAPMYWGYGQKGEYAERSMLARYTEKDLLSAAPDTVLVLLKASPDVIRRRMKESPHRRQIMKDEDDERSLELFDEQFTDTLIRSKFEIDTSSATMDETLAEFVRGILPMLTDADRLRMLTKATS
jgi:shikimate kinase